jgi:hypothetical protein
MHVFSSEALHHLVRGFVSLRNNVASLTEQV